MIINRINQEECKEHILARKNNILIVTSVYTDILTGQGKQWQISFSLLSTHLTLRLSWNKRKKCG